MKQQICHKTENKETKETIRKPVCRLSGVKIVHVASFVRKPNSSSSPFIHDSRLGDGYDTDASEPNGGAVHGKLYIARKYSNVSDDTCTTNSNSSEFSYESNEHLNA